MRKAVIVLTIVSLFVCLAQISQAADLQKGWYVKIAGVALWGVEPYTYKTLGTDWKFSGGLGDYGPFNVSSPDPVWAERMVSVPESVSGVAPGTSVYLWGQPVHLVDYVLNEVDFFWETNCDKSQMQLELLMYNPSAGYTKLWSNSQSPYNSGFTNVLTSLQYIPIGYEPVFRVSVVPEPNGMLAIFTGGLSLLGLIMKKLHDNCNEHLNSFVASENYIK